MSYMMMSFIKGRQWFLCFRKSQSLEVAEHLPEQYAHNFVHLLTSLSDIVLFSAAIPYQGGTHHVNEQPPAYWADIFEKEGFVCFDILRESIWGNKNIYPWYRQNIMFFIHKNKQDVLVKQGFCPTKPPCIINPAMLEYYQKQLHDLHQVTKNYIYFRRMLAKIPFLRTFYRKFIK